MARGEVIRQGGGAGGPGGSFGGPNCRSRYQRSNVGTSCARRAAGNCLASNSPRRESPSRPPRTSIARSRHRRRSGSPGGPHSSWAWATIQRDTRRFFAHLFLSHASLVLVGLELHTSVSLTASLCLWFSEILSLTGFGLTLRALESRFGRLSLTDFGRVTADNQAFEGWVAKMKQRFRQAPPPAPVKQAAIAPAAAPAA